MIGLTTTQGLTAHLRTISLEERLYLLENIPIHLVGTSRQEELYHLLLDYEFLQSKVQLMGSEPAIHDYEIALNLNTNWKNKGKNPEILKTIQRSLQNASHILAIDKSQLASQLVGRLYSSREPELEIFLKQISKFSRAPWVRPISPVFEQARAGGFLQRKLYTGFITQLDITPDSQKIITNSGEDRIKVWDLDSGKLLHTFEGSPTAISITPDSKKLVSGSGEDRIKVWDLDSGKLLHTLEGSPTAISITPDSKKLVTCLGKSIKVWDLEHRNLLYSLQSHKGIVNLLAITPDGKKAISGSILDYTLKVWDIETGNLLTTITDHDARVYSMAVSHDSKWVTFLTTRRLIEEIPVKEGVRGGYSGPGPGSKDKIDGIALAPEGYVIIYFQTAKNTMTVWDIRDMEVTRTLGPTDPIVAVAITRDGKLAFSSSSDNSVKLWNINTGDVLSKFSHERAATIAITPDGKKAVSGSEDGKLKAWDLKKGELLHTFEHNYPITTIAITPDGKKAISGSENGTVKVWDVKKGKLSNMLHNTGPILKIIAITPDGKKAISGSEDGKVRVWDVKNGELLYTFEHTGSQVGEVKLWDLRKGGFLHTFDHDYPITAIAITPDGKKAISLSEDGIVKLCDLKKREMTIIFDKIDHGFEALKIAKDGATATYVTYDEYFHIWDIENSRLLRRFYGRKKDWLRLVSRTTLDGDIDSDVLSSWNDKEEKWVTIGLNTSADGRIAYSVENSNLQIWDMKKEEIIHTMDLAIEDAGGESRPGLQKVAISPDGKNVVTAVDKELMIWDIKDESQLSYSLGKGYTVNSLKLVKNRNSVVVESKEKSVIVWDMNTGEQEHSLNSGLANILDTMAVSDDGRFILTSDTIYDWFPMTTTRLWDAHSGNVIYQFTGKHSEAGQEEILDITGDGQGIYTRSESILKIWDLKSNTELRSWKYVDGKSLRIIGEGQRAIGISDNKLKVWDLEYARHWNLDHAKLICTMEDKSSPIQLFAVASEAQRILSASGNDVLTLWDMENGRHICTLEGHQGAIRDISITPDGSRAASVSYDNTLRIWDLKAYKTIAILYVDIPFRLCGIARDGIHVVAGGGTTGLNFFRLEHA